MAHQKGKLELLSGSKRKQKPLQLLNIATTYTLQQLRHQIRLGIKELVFIIQEEILECFLLKMKYSKEEHDIKVTDRNQKVDYNL